VPDRSPLASLLLVILASSGLARAQDGAAPPAGASDPAAPPAGPAGGPVGGTTDPPSTDPQRRSALDPIRPPPLHVEYAQYGVAILAMVNVNPGAICGNSVLSPVGGGRAPCILGSGGGLTIRGGYRSPGPWYIGGAYAFAKLDSSNLLRLGIFQQLWAEMRYLPDTGSRVAPFATWGLGGVTYGNEWGVETGGAMLFGGGGVQIEVSRKAVVGLGFVYKPTLIAGWTDTAGIIRPTGVANFVELDIQLELRTETGRR
jgi:hypothetical protein